MKNNKFKVPIEKMTEKIIEKNKKNGFPVVCAFLNEEFKVLNLEINSKEKVLNKSKTSPKKHHAEDICYSKTENKNIKIIALITLPPCSNCFEHTFKNFKEQFQIYYFFDEVREKTKKSYLKEYIDNKQIIKKTPSSFTDKNTKYNVYYIIMVCLARHLEQKLNGITYEEIESLAKKWVSILKKVIKNNRPSRGQIKLDEVWSMIEKTKKINIENISHKDNSKEKFEWVVN